jgi:hypothetical protein
MSSFALHSAVNPQGAQPITNRAWLADHLEAAMIAIAFASLIVALYGGYVGAPWWSALICTLTLLVTLATTHLRIQSQPKRITPALSAGLDLLPYSFAAAFGAYALGQVVHLI